MRIAKLILFSCLIAVLAASAASAADGVRVDTDVASDSVTVGERLHVRYTASYPDSLTLLPPGDIDTGTCRLVSIRWKDERESHIRIKRADLVVMPVDLDRALVPGPPFYFLTPAGDTLTVVADDIEVPIRHITTTESEPRPLKPQWQAPKSYLNYYIGAGALVLAALAAWYFIRRRKHRPVVVAPKPELPPDFIALKELSEIEKRELPQAGEFKRHYTLVIDVLRHYVERRYQVETMDRTTDEILFDLSARQIRIDGLERLLQEADLVKFAKHRPEVADALAAVETARDIVVVTTPRPVLTDDEGAKPVEEAAN